MVYKTGFNIEAPKVTGFEDTGRRNWPNKAVEIRREMFDRQVELNGHGEYVEFRTIDADPNAKHEGNRRKHDLVIHYYSFSVWGYDRVDGRHYRFGCQHKDVDSKETSRCYYRHKCKDCGAVWLSDSGD